MPITQTEPVSRSSADFPAYDPDRCAEIQRRHELLAELLRLKEADALLLQRPVNIAWLTCGADVLRAGTCQPTAMVLLTPEARVVLTTNVDSPLLFDGALAGLGFQLKERPWHEPRTTLVADVCRGRKIISDAPICEADVVETELAEFRAQLNEHEEPLLRELARDLTHAVEATCRTCSEGLPESELAGQVMHRLAHRQLSPVRVQVMCDGRSERYRHWGYSDAPVKRYAVVSAIGRRNGLHLGVTRTVSFGPPPESLVEAHHHASLLLGTAFYFSQAGWRIGDVWSRMRRIYEKFGAPDEWRLADQGEVCGYEACETPILPESMRSLRPGQPLFWHPGVGPALVGDSLLVQPRGQTWLTHSTQWPLLRIAVKGASIDLPGILIRDGDDDWAVG